MNKAVVSTSVNCDDEHPAGPRVAFLHYGRPTKLLRRECRIHEFTIVAHYRWWALDP
jgi:hypothetical protein